MMQLKNPVDWVKGLSLQKRLTLPTSSTPMPWYKVDTFPAFKRLFAHPTTPQVVESDSASEMMDPVIEGPTPKPINPQLSCPLFTRIPGEIRNSIFELALTSFDDKQRPYKKSAYYYRPDHRYAQKIDTNLLLTCRRIHAETETIPACINEIVNWCHRSPPDALTMSSYMGNEPGAVRRCQQSANLHLFRQQCCLEGHFKYLTPKLKHFPNITRLKITLRHTDWWWVCLPI